MIPISFIELFNSNRFPIRETWFYPEIVIEKRIKKKKKKSHRIIQRINRLNATNRGLIIEKKNDGFCSKTTRNQKWRNHRRGILLKESHRYFFQFQIILIECPAISTRVPRLRCIGMYFSSLDKCNGDATWKNYVEKNRCLSINILSIYIYIYISHHIIILKWTNVSTMYFSIWSRWSQ